MSSDRLKELQDQALGHVLRLEADLESKTAEVNVLKKDREKLIELLGDVIKMYDVHCEEIRDIHSKMESTVDKPELLANEARKIRLLLNSFK